MPLLEPFVKNYILKKIKLYSTIVACILLLITLRYATSHAHLQLNFIGISLLVWPLVWILLLRVYPPLTIQELNSIALSMIVPTLHSIYHNLSLYGKIATNVVFFVIILPLLYQALHISLWIALITYGFMLIRYIRCLQQIPTAQLTITETTLTIPIFGLFHHYNLTIPYDTITKIVAFGSKQALSDDLSDDSFIRGVRIHYNKNKVLIVSTAIVSVQYLSTLIDHILTNNDLKPYIELLQK